jgi:hypothetical protein
MNGYQTRQAQSGEAMQHAGRTCLDMSQPDRKLRGSLQGGQKEKLKLSAHK